MTTRARLHDLAAAGHSFRLAKAMQSSSWEKPFELGKTQFRYCT